MDSPKLPVPAYFLLAFAVFLVGWYLPITRIRRPDATKNSKTVWSFWLIIFGIAPVIYAMVLTYKARGSANNTTTGGNTPPNPNVVPNQPSNAAGASQELVPVKP